MDLSGRAWDCIVRGKVKDKIVLHLPIEKEFRKRFESISVHVTRDPRCKLHPHTHSSSSLRPFAPVPPWSWPQSQEISLGLSRISAYLSLVKCVQVDFRTCLRCRLTGVFEFQKCYVSIVEDLKFSDIECLKYSLSKGLGVGIVIGGSIMKVPQLLLSMRSVCDVSPPSKADTFFSPIRPFRSGNLSELLRH